MINYLYIFSTALSLIVTYYTNSDISILINFFINLFIGYDYLGLIYYLICFYFFCLNSKDKFFYFLFFVNPILITNITILFLIFELLCIFEYFHIDKSDKILIFFTRLCFCYRVSTFFMFSQLSENLKKIKFKKENVREYNGMV